MTPSGFVWHRGVGAHQRVCGYCVPTRVIAEGELYVTFGSARQFVRCLGCATERFELTPPADAEVPVVEATVIEGATPFDWKRRAAGDE